MMGEHRIVDWCREATAIFMVRLGAMSPTNEESIFQISANGSLLSVYVFTAGYNASLGGALVQGSDGNFYGTKYYGGTNGDFGSVFQLTTNGALVTLYSFTGSNDGGHPAAGLVEGADGNFYGSTTAGGADNLGTLFQLTANGTLTTLYSFPGANDGANPVALVQGSDGNFYGTTADGPTTEFGTLFKMSANGILTNLHSFSRDIDGAYPEAGLVQGNDGNFYGVTQIGGTNGGGTVFEISASGSLAILHSFSGYDGLSPSAGLVQGSDGNFYGTTVGGGQYTNTPGGTVISNYHQWHADHFIFIHRRH